MALAVPAHRGQITTQWLQAALAEAGINARVRAVQMTDGSAGRGFACDIVRLTIDYASSPPDAPHSLIAKLARERDPTPSPWAANEIHWFRSGVCPVRLPRCYWSGLDVRLTRHVLLLEDLGHLRVVHQAAGASSDQALIAVQALARLHGFVRGVSSSKRIQSDVENARTALRVGWSDFQALYGELADARMLRSIVEIGDAIEPACGRIHRRGSCLIHGDFKVDNLLFGAPDGEDAVVVLDWQGVGAGSDIMEFAGFVQGSLTADVRRALQPRLLASYAQTLRECGTRVGPNADLAEDYAAAVLVQFATAVGSCPSIASGRWAEGDASRDVRIRAYSRMMFERRISTMQDMRIFA